MLAADAWRSLFLLSNRPRSFSRNDRVIVTGGPGGNRYIQVASAEWACPMDFEPLVEA